MTKPDLRDRIERRISELRAEAKVGHEMLAQLESQQSNLQRTLLRIGGAIEALEDLVRETAAMDDDRTRTLPSNGASTQSRTAAGEMR